MAYLHKSSYSQLRCLTFRLQQTVLLVELLYGCLGYHQSVLQIWWDGWFDVKINAQRLKGDDVLKKRAYGQDMGRCGMVWRCDMVWNWT